jgi:hypothetical protein
MVDKLNKINNIKQNKKEMLSELGIFISSVLLSLGGCIAISCSEMRRSRCTQISVSDCVKCNRDVIPVTTEFCSSSKERKKEMQRNETTRKEEKTKERKKNGRRKEGKKEKIKKEKGRRKKETKETKKQRKEERKTQTNKE